MESAMPKWNCKTCHVQLVEMDKVELKKSIEELAPNFRSLPKKWKSQKNEYVKVCPQCDAYGLGMELETGYPIRTKEGEVTSIHNIEGIWG